MFVQMIKPGTLGDLDGKLEIPKTRLNKRIKAYNTLVRMKDLTERRNMNRNQKTENTRKRLPGQRGTLSP